MGWAKYYEDNTEISYDRFYMSSESHGIFRRRQPRRKYLCPYCDKIFWDDEAGFFGHIRKEHNQKAFVFTLNDRIAQTQNYIAEIDRALIYLYKDAIQITVNGEEIHYQKSECINITMDMQKALSKSDECIVTIDDNEYSFILNKKGAIKNTVILNQIIQKWNMSVADNLPIKREYPDTINIAEKRFLDGVYNYFVGTRASEAQKIARYNDAYNILLEFRTINSFGMAILKCIAFRRNWFNHLQSFCTEEDLFQEAAGFYLYWNIDKKHFGLKKTLNGTLYIEDEVEDNLKAISAFYNKDYKTVDSYLKRYQDYNLITDFNLRDRILLLKARRLWQLDEKDDAALLMKEILNDDVAKLPYK